LIFFVKG